MPDAQDRTSEPDAACAGGIAGSNMLSSVEALAKESRITHAGAHAAAFTRSVRALRVRGALLGVIG